MRSWLAAILYLQQVDASIQRLIAKESTHASRLLRDDERSALDVRLDAFIELHMRQIFAGSNSLLSAETAFPVDVIMVQALATVVDRACGVRKHDGFANLSQQARVPRKKGSQHSSGP